MHSTPGTQNVFARLSLPGFLQKALQEEGFKTLDDFQGVDAVELANDLKIGRDVAEDVLRQVEMCRAGALRSQIPRSTPAPSTTHLPTTGTQNHHHLPNASQPVSSLVHSRSAPKPTWSSGSTAIDRLFPPLAALARAEAIVQSDSKSNSRPMVRVGLQPGMIVEIASPPGCGKSSLMMSLMMSARVGVEGNVTEDEVLVIDTEGSLIPSKFKSAAQVTLSSYSSTASVNDVLQGIHLVRATTQIEFLAFCHTIESWLSEHDKVRLVVIDTLSYHFRQPNTDLNLKRRSMDLIKQKLAKASTTYGCAVMVANQMATKILNAENKPANFDTGDKAVMMPQLGDTWMPPKTIKVVLFRSGGGFGERHAFVARRPGETEDRPWAQFDIDDHGLVTDVFEPEETT
ncbi:P-loop containing nucleoside triphosphate hydrolase protein [Filobasidium floriforme]|uniref:P-loop containing nucleoside triphosphate hydrolase protein n=1 Tax=Filobasidium floriforme TaxID=5210 RepID=UPI001E8D87F6|nr:P-loop containing nucleoside triphosphate hydrolase protein [Filobasidium floriforme]KAH8081385.1 P-loop containing nucleoside triphosphate hydrolase protein [Filobasidium floriforme]